MATRRKARALDKHEVNSLCRQSKARPFLPPSKISFTPVLLRLPNLGECVFSLFFNKDGNKKEVHIIAPINLPKDLWNLYTERLVYAMNVYKPSDAA